MDNGTISYLRFLDGDDSGLVEIIRNYKDGLILYINGYTGNILAAEELMENVFVKLAVKKPRFLGKSSFKTWLYAVARNEALDYLRQRSKISFKYSADCIGDEESLEQSYLREERKVILHKTLRKLKPEYRHILYLIYFEDFDNAEAAAVMKKSKRQIENLIYRAKQSLKSELIKEGFVYEGL